MGFRTMAPTLLAIFLAIGCVQPSPPAYDVAPIPTAETVTPPVARSYSGEEAREIKALSPEDIAGYESGGGLGYAKPAELNSYPGPLHALEMGDRLGLSEDQRAGLVRLREDMLAEAVPLGQRYLISEAAIERAFRTGEVDDDALRTLLEESARIEAALRYTHLHAHLATKALLTQHQVALYDEARGYGAADHQSHEHGA